MTDTEDSDERQFEGTVPLPWPLMTALKGLIALVAFAMMTLVATDVGFRYLLNSPLAGAFEIQQMLLALLVFLSLPVVVWADENISVGLFVGFFRGLALRSLKAVVMLVNIGGLVLLGFIIVRQYRSLQISQQATGYLELPIYPLTAVMVVLIALSVALQLAMLWHLLRTRSAS